METGTDDGVGNEPVAGDEGGDGEKREPHESQSDGDVGLDAERVLHRTRARPPQVARLPGARRLRRQQQVYVCYLTTHVFGEDYRHLKESEFSYLITLSRWGELESGQTTIAFTPLHQKETDERTGAVHSEERAAVEVCFAYEDVDAAYKRAVENGAVAVSPPESKEWGQKVGYVRDVVGIVVRLGSHVKPSASSSQ